MALVSERLAPFCLSPSSFSGIAVETAVEVRVVVLFVLWHREIHVATVHSATVVLPAGRFLGEQVPDVVPSLVRILSRESTQVTQALAAAECPECLLAEQQCDARAVRARIGQCSRECGDCEAAADHMRGRAQSIENR